MLELAKEYNFNMKYFDELKRSMEYLGKNKDTIFIGLPGNPVSSYVCFIIFDFVSSLMVRTEIPVDPAKTSVLPYLSPITAVWIAPLFSM